MRPQHRWAQRKKLPHCGYSVATWPRLDSLERALSRCVPEGTICKVHTDFAGPIDGPYYLVIVDAYSKWPEIAQMNFVSTPAIIAALKKISTQIGNPQTLLTKYAVYVNIVQGILPRLRNQKSTPPPPFHPQSYGQVERFVDTSKRILAKLKGKERTTDALQTFLMAYRSILCLSEPGQASPIKNFLARQLRTIFEKMMPTADNPVQPRDSMMGKQFNRHHDTATSRSVSPSMLVYRGPKSTWISGTIVCKTGNATYTARCVKFLWTRHINQLRPRKSTSILNQLLGAFDQR
ncbi:unnamed protein product [Toxocara canis]|uniref:Integrase catalytic domain-containing protein n=1 Tax=Toxocara canis TaxID=6265 RepID=A0A183V2P2_TOXCA|nr:unnamed protein product [Toxocara canis]